MKRILVAAVGAALTTLALAGPAAAEPPVNTDGSGHVHRVLLGNGECLILDANGWEAVDRGMHRGANASGPDHGPWHGTTCPVN